MRARLIRPHHTTASDAGTDTAIQVTATGNHVSIVGRSVPTTANTAVTPPAPAPITVSARRTRSGNTPHWTRTARAPRPTPNTDPNTPNGNQDSRAPANPASRPPRAPTTAPAARTPTTRGTTRARRSTGADHSHHIVSRPAETGPRTRTTTDPAATSNAKTTQAHVELHSRSAFTTKDVETTADGRVTNHQPSPPTT